MEPYRPGIYLNRESKAETTSQKPVESTNFDDFYISPEQAKQVLENRQSLRQDVEQFWTDNNWGKPPLPEVDAPLGILARQLWSARGEDVLFYEMAKKAGLTPTFMSYTGDYFVRSSNLKVSYARPMFFTGIAKKSKQLMLERIEVVPVDQGDRKALNELHWNSQNLVDLHAQHQEAIFGEKPLRFDITQWYRQIGPCRDYYKGLLSLFIAHGVLFEDYFGGESSGALDAFTNDVFLPAWQEVSERFRVKPLMVRLPWWKELAYFPVNKEQLNNPEYRNALLKGY